MCAGHSSISFITKKTPSSLVHLSVCLSNIRFYSVSVRVLQRNRTSVCVCVCVCVFVFLLRNWPVWLCVLSCFSCVWLFMTPRTIGHQAPLSMGFSRQEYWSELPCPLPGDLPWPGDRNCFSCISCGGWQIQSVRYFRNSGRLSRVQSWGRIHSFPGNLSFLL